MMQPITRRSYVEGKLGMPIAPPGLQRSICSTVAPTGIGYSICEAAFQIATRRDAFAAKGTTRT